MANEKKKLFGLSSLFSFILAGHWLFFYQIAAGTGGQIVIGANNMSTAIGLDENHRTQAWDVMTKFQQYFSKFHPLQFDWTIGPSHYIPIYLCIFLGILGIAFFVLSINQKSSNTFQKKF